MNDKYDLLNDTIKRYIEDIYDNKYEYAHNRNIENISGLNLECITNEKNTEEEEGKFIVYDKVRNLRIGCFLGSADEERFKINRALKGETTDIIVNTMGDKVFEIFSLKIIDIMEQVVQYYIEVFNSKNVFKLSDNDLVYLYKGGNIIRIYIDKLLGSINSEIINNCIPNKQINNIIEVLTNIQTKQKYGDWDMEFYINLNFSHELYNKIYDDMNKIILPVLEYLKNDFHHLLVDLFPHNFLKYLEKTREVYFIDPELQKMVKEYDPKINIESLQTFNFEVSKNSICKLPPNTLKRNSSIVLTEPNTEKKIFMELDNLLVPKNDKHNMDDNMDNKNNNESEDIFITQQNMKIVSRNDIIQFKLTRLKIYNRIVMSEDNKLVHLGAPFELIDVVVPKYEDTQGRIKEKIMNKINKSKVFSMDYFGKIINIPSPYFLYSDLLYILTYQNIFIWEDKKYEKRLLRFIMMTFYCLLNDNIPTEKIVEYINTILDFYYNSSKLFNQAFTIHNNEIQLADRYNINYLDIFIKHYIHVVLCYKFIYNQSLSDIEYKYCQNVFKYNINFKKDPEAIMITKPMTEYTKIPQNEFMDDFKKYCNELENNMTVLLFLLKQLPKGPFKLYNNIMKI